MTALMRIALGKVALLTRGFQIRISTFFDLKAIVK